MPSLVSMVALMALMSFALYMIMPGHESSMLFSLIGGIDNITESQLYLAMVAMFGLSVVAGLAAAVVSGSINPFAIFANIASSVLLLLAVFPTNLLASTDVPDDIKMLVGGIFGILFVITLLTWFKGQSD